jgi:hypothetical protein
LSCSLEELKTLFETAFEELQKIENNKKPALETINLLFREHIPLHISLEIKTSL